MTVTDDRVWHVRSWPQGKILHTAATYADADQWREETNSNQSIIVPEWPGQPAPPPVAPGRNGRWEKLGDVGVDSASIGVTDLLSGVKDSVCRPGRDSDPHYAVKGSEWACDWGTGIRFWAGFGDGSYEVWGWIADYSAEDDEEPDERVGQIVVTMIDQQDLAQWHSGY